MQHFEEKIIMASMQRIGNVRAWGMAMLGCAVFALVSAASDQPELAKDVTYDDVYMRVHRDPFVQMTTPDSAVIVWQTVGRIDPVVRYGTRPGKLESDVRSDTIRCFYSTWKNFHPPEGCYVSQRHIRAGTYIRPGAKLFACSGVYQYMAPVTGLKPGRTYYYAIYNGDTLIAGGDKAFCFRTHPKTGKRVPVTFWVVGGCGNGGLSQAEVHAAMLAYTAKQRRPLDFMLHTGGMAAGPSSFHRLQRGFFEPYASTICSTVCWPTKGKSDPNEYFQYFVLPAEGESGGEPFGSERAYSFDYGRVHVISLPTFGEELEPGKSVVKWLKADLEKTKKQGKTDWIIAFSHYPPFGGERSALMPALEAGGVDVVFSGPGGCYRRSGLIKRMTEAPADDKSSKKDKAKQKEPVLEAEMLDDGNGPYRKSRKILPDQGIVLVLISSGGGGGTLQEPKEIPSYIKKVVCRHGSVVAQVVKNRLTVRMIDNTGEIQDEFRIEKR